MGCACKLSICVLVVAVLLIIGATVIFLLLPSIVEEEVKKNLDLSTQTGMSYENWKKLQLPLEMKVYFFDVQNSQDVVNEGAKPVLVEKGPYVFSQFRRKTGEIWSDDNTTVTYNQIKEYYHKEGNLDDLITIPNLPAVAIATLGKREPPKMQLLLGNIMTDQANRQYTNLYMTKTVREVLFDGYSDSFIRTVQKASGKNVLPNDTFGIFYGFNMSDDGQYTIHTGKGDASKYTIIKEWKGPLRDFPNVDEWERYDKLPMWDNTTQCSDIKGTDGQQFPPFVKKDTILRIFISEMCRSAYLVYQSDVKVEGIDAYRFEPDINMMADPAINPDNACFCDDPNECMFTGTVGLSKCQKEAPVYASYPHFYKADPILLRTIDGLKPDAEKHKIFLDVEPLTGMPIRARRASQVNLDMKPLYPLYKGADHKNMPRLLHPVMWFSEEGGIDAENAELFKSMAITPVKLGNGLTYGLFALGGFLIICCIFGFIKGRRQAKEEVELNVFFEEVKREKNENIYTEVNGTPKSRMINDNSKNRF